MATDTTPWLTSKEAAARAQCGIKVIYRAVHAGRLKAVKVGLGLRIHVAWLDAWLDTAAPLVNADAPGPALVYTPRRS